MSRCYPWSHDWTKWRVVEYKVSRYSPLQSVIIWKTISYSGQEVDLTKLQETERIAVGKNERTCKKCGITKVRSL